MDWLSLLFPLLYLLVLGGSLGTFSHLYRTRKATKAASLAPWFPPHLQRNIYLTLLEHQAEPSTKVPDSVLRAALFRRATEDIHRLVNLRTSESALSQLLQRGAVGDELWQRFQLAKKEMELELKDVVNEANALAPQQNWGQIIFQSAGEAAQNENLRKKLAELEATRADEKSDWEKRRDIVRDGFMKEIGAVDSNSAANESAKKSASSDEDGVIVEALEPVEGQADFQETQTRGGGSAKKKKGKK